MRFFKLIFSTGRRTYLDYASSTPTDRRMQKRIPAVGTAANPSALHREGVALRRTIDDARKRVAKTLGAHADEIIFTASATESDNLAIAGTIAHWLSDGIDARDIVVFSSEFEHAAVAESIERFVSDGVQHNVFPTGEGVIDPKHLIIPETARAVFVSVMHVSNEIGTIQPLPEIAKRIRRLKKAHPETRFIFHTDATQAPAHLPLHLPALGVDLMTLGTTKLYCQKGVGILYKKRSAKILPIMRGGGQEFGLRPGTEPVSLIHEASYAFEYAVLIREQETERIMALKASFEAELKLRFPHLKVSGEKLPRSPHISHVALPNFDSELLVLELDARGIAVSAKSACKNEEGDEPGIVEKLYGEGWGAVRFSFGRMTTRRDLARAARALGAVVRKYRNALEK